MDARSDPWIFRLVVVFLGLCALAATIGSVELSAYGKDIPGPLTTLGGTAIGAMSGLLAALLHPRPQRNGGSPHPPEAT